MTTSDEQARGAPTRGSTGDRARGALMGLAAGDAVGTTVEFCAPGSFTPLTDMVGGGPFDLAPGQWTDDTSMALCLAESLVDCGDHDPIDQMRRYTKWWRHGYLSSTGHCFDIGVTTSTELRRFESTGEAFADAVDEERAANGSLMRLAPVSIRWFADADAVVERAAASSRPTHPARRPTDTCRVLAAMTAALIRGEPFARVIAADFWRGGALHPEVEAVARGSWRDRRPPEIRGTGFCVDALEAAIWATVGADDFAEAVLRAANLGDDADTTAAIAGQLAGARFGATGIPETWRERLASRTRIESLADALHADALGAERVWARDDDLPAWWAEDRVLAGEYPGDADARHARNKLDLLVDAGVRTIIDLTTDDDPLVRYDDVVRQLVTDRRIELAIRRHPIPDVSVRPDDGYVEILDEIRHALAATDGAVFVHCWGGIGRTGTVIGLRYVEGGDHGADALERLRTARAATRKAHRPSPETPEQRAVIGRWADRR